MPSFTYEEIAKMKNDSYDEGYKAATSDFINCGERNVQKLFRITLSNICERYCIEEGDAVEVFIRKTEH